MHVAQNDWRTRLAFLLLATITLYTLPTTVQAQTPRLQGQSASAAAMGNAFVAQADDPSALHYNPAGMTQLHGFQNLVRHLLDRRHHPVHQPNRRAGDRGPQQLGGLAPSRPYLSRRQSQGSWIHGARKSHGGRGLQQSIWLAHPLPQRRTISHRGDVYHLALTRHQTYRGLQAERSALDRFGSGHLHLLGAIRRGPRRTKIRLAWGSWNTGRLAGGTERH